MRDMKIRGRGKFFVNNFMYIWPIKAIVVSNESLETGLSTKLSLIKIHLLCVKI